MSTTAGGYKREGHSLYTKGVDLRRHPEVAPVVGTLESGADSQIVQETGHVAVSVEPDEEEISRHIRDDFVD